MNRASLDRGFGRCMLMRKHGTVLKKYANRATDTIVAPDRVRVRPAVFCAVLLHLVQLYQWSCEAAASHVCEDSEQCARLNQLCQHDTDCVAAHTCTPESKPLQPCRCARREAKLDTGCMCAAAQAKGAAAGE